MPPTETAAPRAALTVITSLFFLWGFMTVMNDVLVPHLRAVFDLSHTRSVLVQSAFFGAYFIGSLIYYLIARAGGDPIQRIGYKRGLMLGLAISAVGCSLFVPATYVHVYALYLLALFVLGLGITLLQIAANPFVAIIGPAGTASSRLNLAQAFNSLGTTLAPIIGGVLIFRLFQGDQAVRWPYLFFAVVLVAVALLVRATRLPEPTADAPHNGGDALRHPQVRWGMLAIFLYVGVEVSIGTLITAFAGLSDVAGLDHDQAKRFIALYWGGAMVGRFVGSVGLRAAPWLRKAGTMALLIGGLLLLLFGILRAEGGHAFADQLPFLTMACVHALLVIAVGDRPGKLLGLSAVCAIALLLAAVLLPGHWALWALTSIGLFNSVLWGNIFTKAIEGLGGDTAQASSLLVMMILGGALLPLAQAALADSALGLRNSFLLLTLGYAYLAWYGLKEHRSA